MPKATATTRAISARIPIKVHDWLIQRAADQTIAMGRRVTVSDVLLRALEDARQRISKGKP